MPRRTAFAALGAILLLACVGLFLVQPGILRQFSRSNQQQQLRQDFGEQGEQEEGSGATPAPTLPPLPETPRPTQHPTMAPFGYDYPAVVEKKTFSSRMRIIFLVGLEGTGHHYLADVLEDMCNTATVPCPKTCRLAHALYPGMSVPKTVNEYEDARRRLRREMEVLASYPEEYLPEGKATMASFGRCRVEAGMMSYPNYNGESKALQYVDFRLLAEEAERAGVDLRFVYLARSARSILVSDTQHNHYGGNFMKESRNLINNAAVVESIFREVGPGFSTCFRYEDMANPTQASRVASFVAPTNYAAQRLSSKMLGAVRGSSPPGGAEGAARALTSTNAVQENRQQLSHQNRLPNGKIRLRFRGSDPSNGKGQWPQLFGRKQFVRKGVEEPAVSGVPAQGKEEGGEEKEGWKLSMELVVARLQQKLDQIEKGVCVAAASNSSSVP
ncbi:unnamed protein product [Scytosiphon promiscuus]